MKYTIKNADSAQRDYVQNASYIKNELQNPTAAKMLLIKTEEAVESLETLPHRQPLVKDKYLASKGIRMLPVKRYYVFYRIDEEIKEVQIIRQLHELQNWKQILQDNFVYDAILNENITSFDSYKV